MDTHQTLILRVAKKLHLDTSTITPVHTTSRKVYSDGNVYIKISTSEEAALIKQLYPNEFIDSISVGKTTVFAVGSIGSPVNEQKISLHQFSAWTKEIKRIATISLRVPIQILDINREISLLYALIGKDAYNIKPFVDTLVKVNQPKCSQLQQSFLQGDPNFRNVVFDNANHAHMIDFDHARRGPMEWDVASLLMVCQIADRKDLYRLCNASFTDIDEELTIYFLRIRLAQTLVHTANNIEFETPAGLSRRLRVVEEFLCTT